MFTDPLFRFHRWPDGCPTPEDFYYNHLIKCFKPHRLSETFQLQSFLGFLMLKELKAAWWSIYLCTLHTWLLEPHGPLYRGVRASGTLTFFGLMPNLSRLVCIFGALLWFAYDSINTTWCYMLTLFFYTLEDSCWWSSHAGRFLLLGHQQECNRGFLWWNLIHWSDSAECIFCLWPCCDNKNKQ